MAEYRKWIGNNLNLFGLSSDFPVASIKFLFAGKQQSDDFIYSEREEHGAHNSAIFFPNIIDPKYLLPVKEIKSMPEAQKSNVSISTQISAAGSSSPITGIGTQVEKKKREVLSINSDPTVNSAPKEKSICVII